MERRERHTDITLALLVSASLAGILWLRRIG
jgi:hypothetical protein